MGFDSRKGQEIAYFSPHKRQDRLWGPLKGREPSRYRGDEPRGEPSHSSPINEGALPDLTPPTPVGIHGVVLG